MGFPLADAEQSSSPRTGIGSDQEDSKPITLGECSGQSLDKRTRDTPACPQSPCQGRGGRPMTHSQAACATPLVSPSPSQPLPGPCYELGIA